MSGVTEPLSAAIEWLKTEITRTPYGRLSIGVQVHDGKVAKVFSLLMLNHTARCHMPHWLRASAGVDPYSGS